MESGNLQIDGGARGIRSTVLHENEAQIPIAEVDDVGRLRRRLAHQSASLNDLLLMDSSRLLFPNAGSR